MVHRHESLISGPSSRGDEKVENEFSISTGHPMFKCRGVGTCRRKKSTVAETVDQRTKVTRYLSHSLSLSLTSSVDEWGCVDDSSLKVKSVCARRHYIARLKYD
jgi:hypothetical protein